MLFTFKVFKHDVFINYYSLHLTAQPAGRRDLVLAWLLLALAVATCLLVLVLVLNLIASFNSKNDIIT